MGKDNLENIEKSLEPLCMILLALNQRHIVQKYLQIIAKAKEDEHQYYFWMFYNHVKSPDIGDVMKSYDFLDGLASLPYKENYDVEKLKMLADHAKKELGEI